MDAIIDSAPLYLEGFLEDAWAAGALRRRRVHPRRARGRDADLAGAVAARLRDRVHRGAAQHPAHSSCCSSARSCCRSCGSDLDYFPLAVIGLTAYTSPFVAEAIRSGHQRSAGRSGGGRPQHRHGLRADGDPGGAAAGHADGRAAADQRLHRPDQEHLGGRRVLRRRTVRRDRRRHQRPRRRRDPAAPLRRRAATWSSPCRSD